MTENLLPGIELMKGDCAAVLPELPPAHLIRTSPPYDHLREYGGYNDAFDFDAISAACVANLAPDGVLVWVIADQIVDSGENGTSFRPALGFKALGLTLHQTLFRCSHCRPIDKSRALRVAQYMFAFAKGKPMVANIPIDRPDVKAGGACLYLTPLAVVWMVLGILPVPESKILPTSAGAARYGDLPRNVGVRHRASGGLPLCPCQRPYHLPDKPRRLSD